MDLDFPCAELEARIVQHEAGIDAGTANGLVALAGRIRQLRDRGLAEVPSTRLLIAAAGLIVSGIPVRDACYAAIVSPLSDESSMVGALRDLVDATFV
ncbi:MAG: CbbQ/NirQ/NorQ C-terminal domain-containing protein, partial [Pseudomonas sp.]